MKRLNNINLAQNKSAKIKLPSYDRGAIECGIVHFGVGNFHRAHQAVYCDDLRCQGETQWGITGVSLRSPTIRDALAPQDFLYTQATLGEKAEYRIIGSIKDILVAPENPAAVIDAVACNKTKVVTATITEKGYCLSSGKVDDNHLGIRQDRAALTTPQTIYGYLTASLIKRCHNDGGLPDHMALKLVEPLRELFKDEVRKIGVELGLPYDMVYRHPFPGPGLGVRILGEVKREYCAILREADAIFIEELHNFGWYQKTSQAFAVFLPVKSVGVVGDARRYEWVIALRAVETIDFMTARWAHLPYELLEKVSNRIINEISDVSRVSYDVSSKPPATIEWE